MGRMIERSRGHRTSCDSGLSGPVVRVPQPSAYGKWPDQPEFVAVRWHDSAAHIFRQWQQVWQQQAAVQMRRPGFTKLQRQAHWWIPGMTAEIQPDASSVSSAIPASGAASALVWAWPSQDSLGRAAWWVWVWPEVPLPAAARCEALAPKRSSQRAATLADWVWEGQSA